MRRRTLLAMLLGTGLLASCGRRGAIVPPGSQSEDPRIDDFRKKRDHEKSKDGEISGDADGGG